MSFTARGAEFTFIIFSLCQHDNKNNTCTLHFSAYLYTESKICFFFPFTVFYKVECVKLFCKPLSKLKKCKIKYCTLKQYIFHVLYIAQIAYVQLHTLY